MVSPSTHLTSRVKCVFQLPSCVGTMPFLDSLRASPVITSVACARHTRPLQGHRQKKTLPWLEMKLTMLKIFIILTFQRRVLGETVFWIICPTSVWPCMIMHDLLEEVGPYELKLSVSSLIEDKHLTLEKLSFPITSFDYGFPDLKKKPSLIGNVRLWPIAFIVLL